VNDPEIIEAYETLLMMNEQSNHHLKKNELITFLKEHRKFCSYGFYKGFGPLFFSSIIQKAWQSKEDYRPDQEASFLKKT
jgi:hypothetical protein